MAVTIHDVARLARVSPATAGRALGGYGYVSAQARARVEAAARTLGYVPNSVARALASGVSGVIGLVVGDIENPFFAAAARGLADIVEARGYTVLLANSDEDEAREQAAVAALRARQVDGLVVTPHSSSASPHLEAALAAAPVVLLDRTVRGLAVDAVTVDNAATAASASSPTSPSSPARPSGCAATARRSRPRASRSPPSSSRSAARAAPRAIARRRPCSSSTPGRQRSSARTTS